MMKTENLIHLPLEPYKQRYTEHLHLWEQEEFADKFNYTSIVPKQEQAVTHIRGGEVLDSMQRPMWSMQQMETLLRHHGNKDMGKIYFSDFYTTGLDALGYSRNKFQAFAFCWAQSFDVFDFTFTNPEIFKWMRAWEMMASAIYTKVFVACQELKDLICIAAPGMGSKVEVVGLPFNSAYVLKEFDPQYENGDKFDVVYSSRWDREKNPSLFVDLVEKRDDLRFAVCTGWDELRGTDYMAVQRANKLASEGRLTVFTGCDKGQYYAVLSQSRVQLNTALQDWVSFTLLEALTYGCMPLYPNFRSFPETLMYSEGNLYTPYSVGSLSNKLDALLGLDDFIYRNDILEYHNNSLNRIAQIIEQT